MEQRDQFASSAMAAIISSRALRPNESPYRMAEAAYIYADAMVEASKQEGGEPMEPQPILPADATDEQKEEHEKEAKRRLRLATPITTA